MSETENRDRSESTTTTNFIRRIVDGDIETGKNDGRVHTRFPPEPNGYLHIGHAQAISLNFDLADDYGGLYNLRFDDTNPTKEKAAFVDAIKEDIRWLGYNWQERLYFASDYFERLYDFALELIAKGHAFVDDLDAEQIRATRGTLTEPGTNSPHRDRSIEENLDLFKRMRAGEFPDGSRVLRARIDMSSGNINLRDPIMYRILHRAHHRTGDEWCIYPTYDWAHGQSDSIEAITHSICTLEFEDHRPLYDWYLDRLGIFHPQQIEFARLNLTYTVTSKRVLSRLVEEHFVDGWDDPRMPTLAAMRRRGYPPEAIKAFCRGVGVSKSNSVTEMEMLEQAVRENLNVGAPRVMSVLNPLKVTIENFPDNHIDQFDVPSYPQDKSRPDSRPLPFGKTIFIERDDFMEEPQAKFFRLAPGREVRLIGAYYITCTAVIKDESTGEVTELICSYDPESRGGRSPDKRKVKGTLHWVSAEHAVKAEVRLYDRLFSTPFPRQTDEGQDITSNLNPDSLVVLDNCLVEPALAGASIGTKYQFMRQGYFTLDPRLSSPEKLVFNKIVSLRDTWAKVQTG